ncbi:MAG: D-alanine--D-alanine ligase family protein [Bacteroidota bacterium]
MKRILVLCGGQSPEHPISIRSCRNILNAIDREKYMVTVVGISRTGKWLLQDEKDIADNITIQGANIEIRPGRSDCFWSHGISLGNFDVIFPVLHGPNGEDGTIQGLLQLLDIPFVGCDLLSSSISMDKEVAKRLLRDGGVNVSNWITLKNPRKIPSYESIVERLSKVVFVKPSNMGSSVGVYRVSDRNEWGAALEDAFKYDRKVLVEEAIVGRELECAVLGNERPKASGVGEVRSGGFYSYHEKYEDSSEAQLIIPAEIDHKYLKSLKTTAIKSYQTLECKGMARVDMFLTKSGDIYVNEINTIPGFTSISMYPKLWENDGLNYSELISQLIELAIEQFNTRRNLLDLAKSNV